MAGGEAGGQNDQVQENPGRLASPEQGRNSWDREAKLVIGLHREGHREAPGTRQDACQHRGWKRNQCQGWRVRVTIQARGRWRVELPKAAVTVEMGQRGRMCRRQRNWVRRGPVKSCDNGGRFCMRVQVCLSSWGQFSFLKMSATQEDVLI